jgi:colanic acid/amylovoran biosynthesis glycosyltransferase
MKVLHNFQDYLPTSQNWAYRLLNKIPNAQLYIHADKYYGINFYNPQWKFLNYDTGGIDNFSKGLDKSKAIDFLCKAIIKVIIGPKLNKWVKDGYADAIKSEGIDIVHSHFGVVAVKYYKLIKSLNIPHVISFYGLDYEMVIFNNPNLLEKYKELFKTASAFICEGEYGAKTLENYGCPKDKIHIIHLGIDFKKNIGSNKKVNKKIKEEKKLNLLQIANFTEKKGHIYTVEAFGKALQINSNMHLTLVGNLKSANEAWINEEIIRLIDKYKLQDNISLVKAIDFTKLYDYIQNFDVFIHPSCYAKNKDCEGGAPVVILDAQSVGIPIISTFHCDIPEEVTHERTGLLAPEKDVDAIAAHIETFYNMDNMEYQKYSKNAIEHVKTNYNIDKSGEQLRIIYDEVFHNQ